MPSKSLGLIALFAASFIILLPLTADAQASRNGTIVVRTLDLDGQPLPGATATLSSAALVSGEQVGFAGANGLVRFPALAPGIYSVAASMDGFDTQEQGDIRVSVSVVLEVRFVMTIGATDTITVRAEPPLVDIKSTGSANSVITGEFSQQIPSGRSAAGLINYVDGVIGDGDRGPEGGRTATSGRSAAAFGGTIQGTAFLIDGVNMNSSEGGEVETRMDFDNLQEVSFTGVGGQAEVGGYSGIVVNMVSKSGSNELHGAANFFYRGTSFNSQNSDDPEFRIEEDKNWNAHFDLGGPLMRDKLWAYGSIRREQSDRAAEIAADAPGYRKGTIGLIKLTWQINPNAKLAGNINPEYNYRKGAGDAERSPETLLEDIDETIIYNLDYLHVFSQNTFLDAKFGVSDNSRGDSRVEVRDSLPASIRIRESELSPLCGTEEGCGPWLIGSPRSFFDGFRNRYQLNLAVTHYADDFLNGTHDFKVGFQGDWSNPKTNLGIHGENFPTGAVRYEYLTDDLPDVRQDRQTRELNPQGTTLAFFMQDSWTLNNGRVTINPGLRLVDYSGSAKARIGALNAIPGCDVDLFPGCAAFPESFPDLGDHFQPDLAIAPRIGGVVDALGDGTTAIKAHFGRYFPQLIAGMYGSFQAFARVSDRRARWNPETETYDFNRISISTTGAPTASDLRMTYFDEFSTGIERQITSDLSVEFTGIYRNTKAFFDKIRTNGIWEAVPVVTEAGEPFIVYNLVNSDEGEFILDNTDDLPTGPGTFLGPNLPPDFAQSRKYWALDFNVEKRFSNNWQAIGSYVYSRTTGTDDTRFENGRGSSLGPSDLWSDPNVRFFADGGLAHDVPHQIKFLGSVILPYEINFGWFYLGHSGFPYQRNYIFRQGISEAGEVELVDDIERFIEPRASRRLPWANNVDLRAEKAFTFGGRYTAAVLFDIFNVFNSNTVRRVETNDEPGERPFETIRNLKFPRNFRLGFRLDF